MDQLMRTGSIRWKSLIALINQICINDPEESHLTILIRTNDNLTDCMASHGVPPDPHKAPYLVRCDDDHYD